MAATTDRYGFPTSLEPTDDDLQEVEAAADGADFTADLDECDPYAPPIEDDGRIDTERHLGARYGDDLRANGFTTGRLLDW